MMEKNKNHLKRKKENAALFFWEGDQVIWRLYSRSQAIGQTPPLAGQNPRRARVLVNMHLGRLGPGNGGVCGGGNMGMWPGHLRGLHELGWYWGGRTAR